jgi:signal transduction histidine kinase
MKQVHPDDQKALEEIFRAAQTGRDLGIEHRFINAEGDTIWLHTGVRLARKGEGAGVELRGLSIDITYLKQVEIALKEALVARDEFLSIASHELRTPLTPMRLQLQMLDRAIKRDPTALSPDKMAKTLDSWGRQVDRLIHLIEDLLDVSRISSGRLHFEKEEFNLREVIDDVIEKFKPEFARVRSEIRVDSPETVVGTWDRSRIEQVFTNLVTNAIKYAPGKPVEVSVTEDDDQVKLTVRDYGIGISSENQKKVFERYERAVPAKGVTGLGLGLYIAKNIIDAHGGTIEVQSETGKGSTFTVTLPKQARAEEHEVA